MRDLAGKHRGVLSGEPRMKREAQEVSRRLGGFFFGSFLLAAQKKGTRPRGRTRDSNQPGEANRNPSSTQPAEAH